MSIAHGFGSFLSRAFRNLSPHALTFGVIVILLNGWLLFNADSVFTSGGAYLKEALTLYMLLTASFIGNANISNPLFAIDWRTGLFKYLVTFFLGLVVFGALSFAQPADAITRNFTFGAYAVLFGLIVSFNEDVIFGAVLPRYLGPVGSSLVFAIYHYSVYTRDVKLIYALPSFAFAFFAGLFFQYLINDKRFGLPVSSGFHSSYNLFSIGILTFYNIGGLI